MQTLAALKCVLADGSLPTDGSKPLAPYVQPITVPLNVDLLIPLVFKRANGKAQSLTGWSIVFTVRSADGTVLLARGVPNSDINALAGTAKVTINRADTAPALDVPVPAAFAAGAGTLTAGTYYYRISAINSTGETLACQAVAFAALDNTGVRLNWGAVEGATGYRIYGRSSGAELRIVQVGAVVTYLDSGALTPAGALPTADTSAGPASSFDVCSYDVFAFDPDSNSWRVLDPSGWDPSPSDGNPAGSVSMPGALSFLVNMPYPPPSYKARPAWSPSQQRLVWQQYDHDQVVFDGSVGSLPASWMDFEGRPFRLTFALRCPDPIGIDLDSITSVGCDVKVGSTSPCIVDVTVEEEIT